MPLGDFKDDLVMWMSLSWKCDFDKKFKLYLPMEKEKFISEIKQIVDEGKLNIFYFLYI